MHHLEYLISSGGELQATFSAALELLAVAGYRQCDPGGRVVSLDAWRWRDGARLRLPRGFDGGDRIARELATSLKARVLRVYATAGVEWGYDGYAATGAEVCRFRSDHPRRGDEATVLALWAGHGRELVRTLGRVLDPREGPEGPAAVEALAGALGAPYPAGDELENPALRAWVVRRDA